MAKIRTVKGPLGGRTYDISVAGRNEIVLTGPKRMTRKQKWENMKDSHTYPSLTMDKNIRAVYRIAMRPHYNGAQVIMAPCQHPDGSIFYEYVEGSAR